MINCCREAKSYLEKCEAFNIDEIENFIDGFNYKIENYSANGLSCYLLSCVELSLSLSGSIGYGKGEYIARRLKARLLFQGGYYSLVEKTDHDYNNEFDYLNSSIFEGTTFYLAYINSAKLLKECRDGQAVKQEELLGIIADLKGKKSFYHYIDGLLNICEIYILTNSMIDGRKLLLKIKGEKRELNVLDYRLSELSSRCPKSPSADDCLVG